MENTSVAQQCLYAGHIENTASSIAVFTVRCIATDLSDFCLCIRRRRNVCTDSLPRNGSTCHDMFRFLLRLLNFRM
jgi:hypothetical protein